jgi:hypothetical protein
MNAFKRYRLTLAARSAGNKSANTNPSRSTISPALTGIFPRNVGPSHAKL